jgi:hypothetical protein
LISISKKNFCLKKEREWKSENWVGRAFENSLLLPTSSILPTYVQKPALQGFSYFYSIKQFAAGADQIFRSSDWGRFTWLFLCTGHIQQSFKHNGIFIAPVQIFLLVLRFLPNVVYLTLFCLNIVSPKMQKRCFV